MTPLAHRVVIRVVEWASRFPWIVLALALGAMMALGACARRIEVRSDFLELLPRDSPRFHAFEHQLGRVGGRSTLIVVVSSPQREENERFIDDLAARLDDLVVHDPAARALVAYVESGTKDVRSYYERNKWLYADLADLEQADRDLDHQIALRSGLVEDLEAPDKSSAPPLVVGAADDPSLRSGVRPTTSTPKKHALGMDDYRARWDKKASDRDSFPSGYFATPDGKLLGLRIVTTTWLGDARGDALLAKVERLVAELDVAHRHPEMRVGFTGDVASAADEKKALLSEAAWATGAALVVILVGIVLYFRSVAAPIIIATPALFGVCAAYAFAEVAFGYVNTSGAFLGAIILGNGINYPIVLLSRYQEFRARGLSPDVARRDAVLNALRAELVGACVASIAYGSLVVTRFRGFNQFGAIGFVGMLLTWLSIVPLVPALVVLVERAQPRLPRFLRDRPAALRPDGSRSRWTGFVARATTRRPWVFVALGLALTGLAVAKIPAYLADPWEYDFGKLGSRRSDVSGAGEWSNKANAVFGGKANIAGALMLADTPEQVPLVKKQMLENDARDPQGKMIDEITTLDDLLPGEPALQQKKLEVLDRIRARLTPRVLSELDDDERKTVDEIRPPESLRVLGPDDLPALLRRRFTENDGRVGTVFYVRPRGDIVFADGHNHLRLSKTTDNVRLPDGTVVMTASRSTVFAEILDSLRRDGPLVSLVSFAAVVVVVVVAARNLRVALSVVVALTMAVVCLAGGAAMFGVRLNYVSFVAFPITFGIGAEYPFNVADRVRLLKGDVAAAVARSSGAVLFCSFTTVVGYGSLLLSDFQALESFGKLAVSGELACVFAGVFFLPSLLMLVRRRAA